MATALHGLPRLILASASPRRAELLRECAPEFEVIPSSAAEIHHDQLTAAEVSQVNAWRKALAVARRHPDALVLGADTLVCLEGRLFGKPKDLDDAVAMLEHLGGHTHQVVTGMCLIHLHRRRRRLFAETTDVTFRPLDHARIHRYLEKVDPLDKAGAYAIQEGGELIVEGIAGSYTNVVGLPLERLRLELEQWPRANH